jgi:tight adherence protein B
VWLQAATAAKVDELEVVAAAWTLADTAGVALADAVELAARLLRESRTRQARLEVLLAGPRATMLLLTVLPMAGPLVGLLFGIDPLTLYGGSSLALGSLCCGLALLVLGRIWCRALLRHATSATAGRGSTQRPPQRFSQRATQRSSQQRSSQQRFSQRRSARRSR